LGTQPIEEFVADDDLGDPGAVPEIDEGDATVVASLGDPTREGDGLTNVAGTQGAGLVGAEH